MAEAPPEDVGDESQGFGSVQGSAEDGMRLPATCTVIEKNSKREVYVVGTAHFSKESQEDVSVVLRTIQPHVVFLELCSSRLAILSMDEERLLREAKDVGFQKMQLAIKRSGLVTGIMQTLLLSLSAKLTEQLGMAPGGEFRRAFQEAQRIPHCKVVYGDRPIGITLKRAIGSLTLRQKFSFAWHMISSDVDLSAADIEKCKDKDILEQMLSEMAGEFPSLSRVFVDERDIYLAHALKRTTTFPLGPAGQYTRPIKVVAVLGIGHVNGVVKKWDEDLTEQAQEVMEIPQATLTERGLAFAVKAVVLVGVGYCTFLAGRGAYRLVNSAVRKITYK